MLVGFYMFSGLHTVFVLRCVVVGGVIGSVGGRLGDLFLIMFCSGV